MEIVKVEFNYQMLDTESRITLKQRAERINERTRRVAQDIWENGREFYEAQQELAKYGSGRFLEWVETETGYNQRAVYRMIDVFKNFVFDNLSKTNIAPSALYLLAAPSTEPETRQQFIEQAQAGQPVTHKAVKQAVQEYGYSKAQQTKLPPKIKTAFTASPPALDDFNQARYDDDFTQAGGAGNGNIPTQFGGMIATLEAAGWFVVSPDLKYGLPRLFAAIEPAGYFVISPEQANDPNCPYCAHKF